MPATSASHKAGLMGFRIALLTMALLIGCPPVTGWASSGQGAGTTPGVTAPAVVAYALLPTAHRPDSETPQPVDPPPQIRPPTEVVRPTFGWAWPVFDPHEVVRGFDPPGAPWGAGHRGVDLRAVVGGPVFSPADGVVTFAGVIAGRAVLVVAHANGLRSTFEPVVATLPVGASITRGQSVGTLSASPGHCAPAACLHWGVLRGAVYLDPLGFLRQPVVLLPIRAPPG